MASSKWLGGIGRSLKNNSPAILSGIAVAGVVGTAVLAVKATPKAMEALAEERIRTPHSDDEIIEESKDLSPKQIIQVTWRCFLPAALSAAATIACVIGANSMGARRRVALAGAYTLVDQSFRDYKDKVLEQIGPQKAGKVEDEVAKERLQRQPVSNAQVILTGIGEQLCMDTITGRYFKCDIESIRKAQNTVNQNILQNMYAPLNEFYDLLGLPSVTIGEELGWNIDNLLDIHFSSLLNEFDQPCLVVGYTRLPRRDYDKN
jgi:hypothetical protein